MDSSSSTPSPRRMPDDDDLEEGQFVPGSDTDDDARGRRSPREDDEARAHPPPHGHKRRHLTLEEVLALGRGDALPSPTLAASSESEGTRTISDDYANHPSSPASVFMTTTQPKRAVAAALDGGWAATGKRGWTGGKPAAAAAAVPPNANVAAADDSSRAQAVVVVHQPAAPPALLLHLSQLAHQAAAPPPAEHHEHGVQLAPQGAAAAASADHPPRREYTCKECGKSYPTNQALGGHAAGHRNKRRVAEAAAAAAGMAPEDGGAFLAALRRGRGASAPHECQKCRKVFATGVALGGHMRVHYTGPPIVPCRKKNNKKIRGLALGLAVDDVAAGPPPPGLSLALSIKKEEAPSPTPAGPARVVRLFGIDISPQVQAPSEEQPCSGTTTEDSSSAAGRQQ